MSEINEEDLENLVQEKIQAGKQLIQTLTKYNIDGVSKLERKIKQEINFLIKIHKANSIKKEHLQCTNLTHFSALLMKLHEVKNCVSVNKSFGFNERKITVDIVGDGGLSWIKVIARNPKSISRICEGDAGYGVRSVIDQAEEFLDCAALYPTMFQTPSVTFYFSNGVGKKLAKRLESFGIVVEGIRLDLDEQVEGDEFVHDFSNTSCLSTKNTSNVKRVNLDVSALLAYVSSVTNGSCNKYELTVPVLAQQASWECVRPVKPVLDNFFLGKTLYCCETARSNFINILNTVGGPNEKLRGFEFLNRITVLPDDATVADTIQDDDDNAVFENVQYTGDISLEVGGKIRERSLIIFMFGDRIQAVTVTANDGFVKAAKQKGVNFVVFVHESRALTEQKESKAKLKS